MVLWFCILFWLVDVSVVDDWEDILRCSVMMIFWWSRRLRSRTMWKRWGSHQTITLEVLFLLFARWNCRHSSGLDAVVEVFISFQQIPCTIVQITGARFASKHLIHFLPTYVNLAPLWGIWKSADSNFPPNSDCRWDLTFLTPQNSQFPDCISKDQFVLRLFRMQMG